MHNFKNFTRSIAAFLAALLLLVSTSYQSASAAMIGTERLLQAAGPQRSRDELRLLTARVAIRDALTAQGIAPHEVQLRIQSLTDDEIQLLTEKLDDLAAGRGVFIFSMVIVAVIIAAFLIFNYTPITDVFP